MRGRPCLIDGVRWMGARQNERIWTATMMQRRLTTTFLTPRRCGSTMSTERLLGTLPGSTLGVDCANLFTIVCVSRGKEGLV